jgi:hypothetical protein
MSHRRRLALRVLVGVVLAVSGGSVAAGRATAAQDDLVRRAAEESRSEDRQTRLRGIRALASLPGAAPIEALALLLRAEPADPSLREESWYEAARALWQASVEAPLPAPVLDDLRALATRPPEVTDRVVLCRTSVSRPRWDYPKQALAAIASDAYNRERRALDREVASLPPRQEIAVLSRLAWGPGPKAGDARRAAARARLLKAGSAGLDDALAALPMAPDPIRRQLVDYFRTVYGKTRDPRSVDGIAALMDSQDEATWKAAYAAAGSMAWQHAMPVLVGKLAAGEPDERRGAALRYLAEGKDPALVAIFAAYLDDPEPGLRELAARTLAQLGEQGLRRLAAAANGASAEGRQAALAQLRAVTWRDPAMHQELAALLPPDQPAGALLHASSDDRELRRAALQQLAAAPDERSLETLRRVVSRSYGSETERQEVWEGVAEVGRQLALRDALVPVSEEGRRRLVALLVHLRQDRGASRSAAIADEALAQLAEGRIRSRVRDELTQPRGVRIATVAWTDQSRTARETARQLLAEQPDAVALSRAMIPEVQDPSVLREMPPYFEAAYPTAPEQAAAALVDLVASYTAGVRLQALQAIARLRPPPAVSAPLVAQLEEHDDDRLRQAAFPALVAIGDDVAIGYVLEKGLSGGRGYGDLDTSRSAARALVTLGARGHGLLFEAVESGSYLAQRASLESLLATGDPAIRARLEEIARTTRDRGLQLLIREKSAEPPRAQKDRR